MESAYQGTRVDEFAFFCCIALTQASCVETGLYDFFLLSSFISLNIKSRNLIKLTQRKNAKQIMWEIKYEKFPNLLSNWWKHLIKITLPHTASVKKFQQEATLLCAHSARLYFHNHVLLCSAELKKKSLLTFNLKPRVKKIQSLTAISCMLKLISCKPS